MGSRRVATSVCRAAIPAPCLPQATQFVKLARDCQLIGSAMSEADPPLMEADVQVRWRAVDKP